jgi:hypothetical protein
VQPFNFGSNPRLYSPEIHLDDRREDAAALFGLLAAQALDGLYVKFRENKRAAI